MDLIYRGHGVNKTELIDHVAEGAGLSKAAAGKALDVILEVITKAVKQGDTVTLVGFGSFKRSERAARTGRNPQTGETIKIKASRKPSFTAGKAFKDAVNHG